MSDPVLDRWRDLIQVDIGSRGLRTDPERNLVNAFPDDFRNACRSIADHPQPSLVVVTGFFIPTATPPAGETDGPLGALFLARALVPLGIPVVIATDAFCAEAIRAGLAACGLNEDALTVLPGNIASSKRVSHLLAIERVGPGYDGRCHTMRGIDITDRMTSAHELFEGATRMPGVTTIGIGDGGNEIGMGKIDRDVIERNIPRGRLVACRVPADHLIVCGVSNWGAYALAAGIAQCRGQKLDARLFDPAVELDLLERMVESGPLVDGVLGRPSATVDGLTWGQYSDVLKEIGKTASRER